MFTLGKRTDASRRVVLIDDSEDVRYLMASFLDADRRFEVVGEAPDVRGGRQLVADLAPDLAVVDLALGHEDGTELVRALRREHPDVAIAVVTSQGGLEVRVAATEAGADAVLPKDALTCGLVEALAAVHSC
jgi:DNA-binding NarL/FixJ family response regulator